MAESKIIIISTHLLEEVDAVCNRVIIIDRGQILADDTPQNLEARSKFHNAVSIKFADRSKLKNARTEISLLPGVLDTEVNQNADRLTAFPTDGQMLLKAISELANAKGWDLSELYLESGRLDEVFRTITGGAAT